MAEYFEYGFRHEEPSHTHAYLLPKIKDILKLYKSGKILDIGCGNGSMAIELIKQGYDVYGIDASETGINIAKRFYPDRFFLQNINSKKLPIEIEHIKFDTLISTEVIEHLFDPKGYIQFCKNILFTNGGGTLIISTPYHGFLKNLLISLTNKWDSHLNPFWDGGHIKFWSKNTLITLLRNYDFTNIRFYGCGRIPYLWKSMIITGQLKFK